MIIILFWILPRLIYALNYILKSDFDTIILPIISFIKIFVAEKVAKSLAEWCRVVVRLETSFISFYVDLDYLSLL